VSCWCVIQEECQHIPVACYQENLSIIEAYNDPQLQPVVVMKKLDESRLFLEHFPSWFNFMHTYEFFYVPYNVYAFSLSYCYLWLEHYCLLLFSRECKMQQWNAVVLVFASGCYEKFEMSDSANFAWMTFLIFTVWCTTVQCAVSRSHVISAVPMRQSHCRSGLATLPSVAAVP